MQHVQQMKDKQEAAIIISSQPMSHFNSKKIFSPTYHQQKHQCCERKVLHRQEEMIFTRPPSLPPAPVITEKWLW